MRQSEWIQAFLAERALHEGHSNGRVVDLQASGWVSTFLEHSRMGGGASDGVPPADRPAPNPDVIGVVPEVTEVGEQPTDGAEVEASSAEGQRAATTPIRRASGAVAPPKAQEGEA